MKPTKHAATNYKKLLPYIEGMHAANDYRKFAAPGMMDLTIEYLHYNLADKMPVFSMACYGEQNGDLMRDPDMTFAVHTELHLVEPLTFQNDYLGIYQEVWDYDAAGNRTAYRQKLRTALDQFLWHWLDQIKEAGYKPKDTK